MINLKINGKSISIPTHWNDVTYTQYLEIFNLRDDVLQLVSILSGIDYEILRTAEVIGLDRLLEALSFINVAPEFPTYVSEVGPYKIPANSKGQFNIQYESLGQFEDARQAMMKMEPGASGLTKLYGKFVSIYLQKIKDGKYDPLKVPEMEEEIKSYPAYQVITLGAFFFLKLKILLNGTVKTSPPSQPSPKRKAYKNSHRSSAHTRKSTR